jgi:glycosyltransferase involved in cell wall biosynthesis
MSISKEKLKPTISIIIPCRNEEKFIDKCLKSVFSFDPVPGGIEVIVVDGMSDDGTRDILSKWMDHHPNLKVLDNTKRIVPAAMNIGIKAAEGDWIVRLDAHSEYPKDYLRLCLETGHKTGADNVGGVFKTLARDDSAQAMLVQALTTHRLGVGNANFRLNASEGPADTVPYGCYRREVFNRIGFYDERLVRNQDYEFNRRLIHKGRRIWLNPKIHVYYYNQGTILGLLRQAFLTAQWNTYMWYVAPYTFALRHLIPAFFVSTLIGSIILSHFTIIGLMLFISILSLYAVFAFIASMQQSGRYVSWMAPLLLSLFFVYHTIYGIGTLWGALRIILRDSPVQVRQ